ncbi:MAG: T9SS type A sorting domain-containing protein [Bacteroidia bacterium]
MIKNILSSTLLFFSATAFAQWNPDPAINNTVCVQPYDQINAKIVTDLKGGAIVVWQDYRNDPTRTQADIYAQRIDSKGNAKWIANGVPVCTELNQQSAVTAVSDSSGGAIIVWHDYRNPKRNLYAQRIDSSGNVLWTADGIPVAFRNFDQQNPKILNDGNHGAVILWQDSVGGAYDIYAQRLSPSGAQLWSGGIAVCSYPLSQVNVKAQINNAGDIYVTWQDKRNGSDYDIYVQKLNLAGAAQWTANGINVCNLAGTQSNPKISITSAGDAIITWQDKRNGVDYDVYAQRVNAAGTPQWTTNGVAVCNTAGTSQSAVDITTQGISNGAIITWKDARNGTNNIDIYAQKLNLSGTAQWTTNGIAVVNSPANQLAPNIIGDGIGGAIIAFQDSSAGNWDIRSQRISSSGTKMWASTGMGVGIAPADQINHNNISAETGNSIYAFQDMRGGDYDIYIYKLDSTGMAVAVSRITNNNDNIRVFPNPSNGKIEFIFANETENKIIIITDVNGKEILKTEEIKHRSFTPDKVFNSGVYFYSINTPTSRTTGKFVVVN